MERMQELFNEAEILRLGELRRRLHRYPEVSEHEHETARVVERELRERSVPDRLITGLGSMGTGICALYEGRRPGPTVMLRCELDALPIQDLGLHEHRSEHDGVAHLCGHDGHMTTMIAVAHSLRQQPLEHGRAVLLFQPAEETGTGAAALLEDQRFLELEPDLILGFHNLPTFPAGTVVARAGTFAAASVGFVATFEGRTSHSSYPEYGLSPTSTVSQLLEFVNGLERQHEQSFIARSTGTVTSAALGAVELGPNFGTAPGEAVVMGVLRAYHDQDLGKLKSLVSDKVRQLAEAAELHSELEWREEFAATENDAEVVEWLESVAEAEGWQYQRVEEPFRWSEDFGRYLTRFKGAFFGIGAGETQPQLHSNTYDYPDEIIPVGAGICRTLLERFTGGIHASSSS